MTTRIWNVLQNLGPPTGGNADEDTGGDQDSEIDDGPANEAPSADDVVLNFDHVTIVENAPPTGRSQTLYYKVTSS